MKKFVFWLKVVGYVLLGVVACVPGLMFYLYLRQSGKTVVLYPSFKIVDIVNTDTAPESSAELSETVRLAEEILQRIKQ